MRGAGEPRVTLQPTSPRVTQSTSGSLANEERVFLKRIQTAETLLKAYTYKQHECDYHIPTVYMVLKFPGRGKRSIITRLTFISHGIIITYFKHQS